MADARGFLRIARQEPPKRPVHERLRDFREVEARASLPLLREQATRCMDCGIPFCHQGCPLGNFIPEWNDAMRRGKLDEALERLHATNNFPEFTGKVCPAPCEESCVLNLQSEPVTIKSIESEIVEQGWEAGLIQPRPAAQRTGKKVAVVGSGPAGLAAAQQLVRAGHEVVVFEKDDRIGGLLRYGIPDFKLDKRSIDRRLEQLRAEGVVFRTGVQVGVDVELSVLRSQFDALCLAIGAQRPRSFPVPGSELQGVHYAMDYLSQQNRGVAGDRIEGAISARDRRVVILGGGDTGADCLGTALRQGALEVQQFHYKAAPPSARSEDMPWPWWPMVLRESTSHEEGGVRDWNLLVTAFEGQGKVERLHAQRVEWVEEGGRLQMRRIAGSELRLPVDLVLIAIGFEGPQPLPGVASADARRVEVDSGYQSSMPGVFACGDATRGASLVVWAIWEGREAAHHIDAWLMGSRRLPTLPNYAPF